MTRNGSGTQAAVRPVVCDWSAIGRAAGRIKDRTARMSDSIGTRKAAARRDAKLRRQAAFDDTMVATAVAGANRRLAAVLTTRFGEDLGRVALAGYIPIGSELSPLPCMIAHPGPVCVPVVRATGQPLEFWRWAPDARMVRSSFNTLVPEIAEAVTPDVVIVPMLAFDRRGVRLGYGGGFYDRTLPLLRARRAVLAVGLAFAVQQQSELPAEKTDAPLDMIVTEDDVLTMT